MPRTSDFDQPEWALLLRKQHGVIARGQALGCGMTERVVRYRIRGPGPWQVLLPGVYLTRTGQPTDEQREMAALLYAGPRSVLTGMSALRRHGLSGPRSGSRADRAVAVQELVDVLVPLATQRTDAGWARLHRTARLPELVCAAGEIRYVLPPRAVADAVRPMTNMDDVRAVVAEAVQRGRCPLACLAGELAGGPARGSARLRRALAEVAEGVRSVAEADLRNLIVRARLPVPLFNPRLMVGQDFLAKPDCWWPDRGVAAEADSRAWHLSPRDWEDTLARHARMSAHGIIVLHFTPAQIRGRRDEVAHAIRKALGSGRPLPQIRAIPSNQAAF
jgi:hypothetical protein